MKALILPFFLPFFPEGNIVIYQLCDKKDKFSFFIVRMRMCPGTFQVLYFIILLYIVFSGFITCKVILVSLVIN